MAVFPNPVPGGTPALHIFLLFLIKHTWISSLVETQGPEIYWSEKADIQNLHFVCLQEQGWETLVYGLHYTTGNAFHVTVHAGTTKDMYVDTLLFRW